MAPASRFLPSDFGPERTVAIIAGKGRYPALLAECAKARGAQVSLVAFEEETDPALFDAFPESRRRSVAVVAIASITRTSATCSQGWAAPKGSAE